MRNGWMICALAVAVAAAAPGCGKVKGVGGDGGSVIDAGGTGGDGGERVDAGPCTTPPCRGTSASFPAEPARDLDILFVIDNSGTMAEEQASLLTNTSRFVNVLQSFPGGLPDVHIGVVSTNLGSGPWNIASCAGDGDGGRLLTTGSGITPCGVTGNFLSDVEGPGGVRTTNYTGTLSEAVSCMTALGTTGCGFEQPLEAMRRALNESNPENAGFLRPDAFLAVIILSDEDDCSVSDTDLFDTSQNDVDAPLGPLSSFRCFEFGVRCTPDEPRDPGTKLACAPRADSAYMFPVGAYIDFLRGIKDDPRKVVVAGILGDPTPVTVAFDEMGYPELQPSCESAAGSAAPAIRTKAFLDGFPLRSAAATICNEDLSDAIVEIAQKITASFAGLCLSGDVHDTDPGTPGIQPDCVVTETHDDISSELPECDNRVDPGASSNLPCYAITPDALCTAGDGSGLAIAIYRGGAEPPAGAWIDVACLLD